MAPTASTGISGGPIIGAGCVEVGAVGAVGAVGDVGAIVAGGAEVGAVGAIGEGGAEVGAVGAVGASVDAYGVDIYRRL